MAATLTYVRTMREEGQRSNTIKTYNIAIAAIDSSNGSCDSEAHCGVAEQLPQWVLSSPASPRILSHDLLYSSFLQ